jgi:hypothetical protein
MLICEKLALLLLIIRNEMDKIFIGGNKWQIQ